ncbi:MULTISPECIES: hypothetical protein [unclassified Marinovum]
MKHLTGLLAVVCLGATPVAAEIVLSDAVPVESTPAESTPAETAPTKMDIAGFRACIDTQIAAQAPTQSCIQAELRACGTIDTTEGAAAAVLCYVEAKNSWTGAIKTRLNELRAAADEKIADIAGVEVKYDVLSGLLQCDRLQELSLLTDRSSDEINIQKSGCTATTMGLAYAKLLVQSRNLP